MFCVNCGNPLEEDQSFCTNCGTPVSRAYQDATPETIEQSPNPLSPAQNTQNGQQPTISPSVKSSAQPSKTSETVPSQPSSSAPRKNRKGLIIGCIIAGVVIVAAIVVGIILFSQNSSSNAKNEHPVIVSLDVPSYSEECTKIPIEATGTNAAGDSVVRTFFVGSDGVGVVLEPGSYKLAFPASPLTPDGILYAVPTDTASVDVANDLEPDASVDVSGGGKFAFQKLTALDETPEMINVAYDWAIKDESQKAKADELKEKALQVHDEAYKAAASNAASVDVYSGSLSLSNPDDLYKINLFLSNFSELGSTMNGYDSQRLDTNKVFGFAMGHVELNDPKAIEHNVGPMYASGFELLLTNRVPLSKLDRYSEQFLKIPLVADDVPYGTYLYSDGYVYFHSGNATYPAGIAYTTALTYLGDNCYEATFRVYGGGADESYTVTDQSYYKMTPEELQRRFPDKGAPVIGTATFEDGYNDKLSQFKLLTYESHTAS